MFHSSSWKKRNEEVVPGKYDRVPHQRDGRDSDQRRRYRRWGYLRVVAFFGVTKASAAQRRRRRCRGVRLPDDVDGALEEDDEEGADDLFG